MRTAFIVGIFGLALAAAGTAEWASRRALAPKASDVPEAAATVPRQTADGHLEKMALLPGAPTTLRGGSFAEGSGLETDNGNVVLVIGGPGAHFRANAQSLSEAMVDAIDLVFAGPEAAELACAQFLIEGHTDNLGSADVNKQVGLSRALAVRAHLGEHYGIPRDAMRVVSYGSERPLADNSTPEGRAINRRVVVKMVGHAH